MKVGLRREYAVCRSKWSVGVNQIAAGLRCNWAPPLVGGTTGFQTLVSLPLMPEWNYLGLADKTMIAQKYTHVSSTKPITTPW